MHDPWGAIQEPLQGLKLKPEDPCWSWRIQTTHPIHNWWLGWVFENWDSPQSISSIHQTKKPPINKLKILWECRKDEASRRNLFSKNIWEVTVGGCWLPLSAIRRMLWLQLHYSSSNWWRTTVRAGMMGSICDVCDHFLNVGLEHTFQLVPLFWRWIPVKWTITTTISNLTCFL